MKRWIRSTQSRFPWLRAAKFEAYNAGTRAFGWRVEPEFKLLAAMAPAGLALDIGGNWGQSIWALTRYAKPARVVSFEPNAYLAARLQRRFETVTGVMIEACGLSDREGQFDLYTPRYRNFIYDGLASLNRDEAAHWLNPQRMAGFDAQLLHVDSQTVATRTLDSFGYRPDIVKIDVQGHEAAVVAGGIETFAEAQPVSIIEAPDDALVARFAGIGMTAYRVANGRLERDWRGNDNVLFLSDRRRAALGL